MRKKENPKTQIIIKKTLIVSESRKPFHRKGDPVKSRKPFHPKGDPVIREIKHSPLLQYEKQRLIAERIRVLLNRR